MQNCRDSNRVEVCSVSEDSAEEGDGPVGFEGSPRDPGSFCLPASSSLGPRAWSLSTE